MKLLFDAVKTYALTNWRNIIVVAIAGAVTAFFPAQAVTVLGLREGLKTELTQE